MRWVSTKGNSPATSLGEALRRGLAPDGGLYLPEHLEPMPASFLERLDQLDFAEIAKQLARHLLNREVATKTLDNIVAAALDFPVPLVHLSPRIWILELFHGPTLAFKDIGARFLARLLEHTGEDQRPSTVLVATSGDTGGAVAQAFLGVERARVAVLYPRGQVSPIQERQFTTLGGNIRAFAVEGTFDDCQRLVKRAFAEADTELSELALTSANSINVGRLLPQIFYYFQAAARLGAARGQRKLLVSIPSGNFGNLTAGLLAKRLGLECRFLAATNENDVVPEYLDTGVFSPRTSVRTHANAMDVGNPSNLARIRSLYGEDLALLRRDVEGYRVDDSSIEKTIRRVDRDHGYVLDPHTAVGYRALERALKKNTENVVGVVLATAHPTKFPEIVEPAIGRPLVLPRRLAKRLDDPVLSETLPNDYAVLRRRLLAWDRSTR